MIFIDEQRVKTSYSLLNRLKESSELSLKEYKFLLEASYYLLSSENDEYYNIGLSIICHVAEEKPKDKFIQQLLFDCIVESRVFLYHEMYEKIDKKYSESIGPGMLDEFTKSFYTLATGTVLTKDQKHLFGEFKKYKRLVVSAPTSFGKSRIVSEIIIDGSYSNIAIILPTIALLNETYLSFRKNELIINRYNLVNNTSQEFGDTNNIFVVTPEKMDILLDANPNLKIDFFTMDEIYKIQDDGDRSNVFTHCLYRLSKMSSDFYLIGPYFNKFSDNFLERTNAVFRKYSAEIVQKSTINISELSPKETFKISNFTFKKTLNDDRNLINILNKIDGQTLVYLGRKDTVETRARKLAETKQVTNKSSELIDYIKSNIDNDWSLIDCLSKGIAFHHGAIPKYIQIEIVDAFNKGEIDVLVCTSTLTEGVNTSAKNVIIYDNVKGRNLLTGFEVKNIKGRAGRFLSHFVGRVITLAPINDEKEKDNIEFSYFDDNSLTPEQIIQIDSTDLHKSNLEKRIETEHFLQREKIPLELIKRNKFIPIQNQYSLIMDLRNNKAYLKDLLFLNQYPTKEQLDQIMQLCYEHLFSDKHKYDRKFTIGNLIRLTKFYIYYSPTTKELIAEQNGVKTDTRIRSAFSLISDYFEFALPKYFAAFENLFNFVCYEFFSIKDAISMKTLITKLEFGSVEKHEIILKEAGVPVGIIRKIADRLSDCDNIHKIRAKLSLDSDIKEILSGYEKSILEKYL